VLNGQVLFAIFGFWNGIFVKFTKSWVYEILFQLDGLKTKLTPSIV
jgi:hypothetical protein